MTAIGLVAFAVAIVICTASAAALVGHALRPRPSDRLLLWFGVFSAMYGIRMFFKQPLAAALRIPDAPARWVEASFNYVILIPALLFVMELYGQGWRRALRWLTAGTTVFAVAAIIIDVAAGSPDRVPDPSLPLLAIVLAVVVAGAVTGYAPPRFHEWRALLAGVMTFMLFIINDHAVGAGLVPWRFSAEPIGFLIQLGCFGYIALARVFAQGRQLAAVEQEMRSAREIQASIVPRDLPDVDGVRLAARYEPLAAVAGDFYDVVPLDGGTVAMFVADVSGHGVPAALIASMVKVAFTAGLRESRDPAAVLQGMNATLCGMFERSYVTAACAFVQLDAGLARYAVAGHPPPLLLSGGDSIVHQLDERGLFLGVMPSASYRTATVAVPAGSRLVFYTDGVTETPGPDEELFGIERLAAFVRDERDKPPGSFADGLMGALRRFAARDPLPHDDVTLLVLDVCGRHGRPSPGASS